MKEAKAWAKSLGISITENLGSGDHGTAYLTSDDRVIKITSDPTEFNHAAQMLEQELTHPNIVPIHSVKAFPSGMMGILMDKVEVFDSLKFAFNNLHQFAADQEVDILEVDFDMYCEEEFMLEIATQKLFMDIEEFGAKHKLYSSDIHPLNIGLCGEELVVFDLRTDLHKYKEDDFLRRFEKALKNNPKTELEISL